MTNVAYASCIGNSPGGSVWSSRSCDSFARAGPHYSIMGKRAVRRCHIGFERPGFERLSERATATYFRRQGRPPVIFLRSCLVCLCPLQISQKLGLVSTAAGHVRAQSCDLATSLGAPRPPPCRLLTQTDQSERAAPGTTPARVWVNV